MKNAKTYKGGLEKGENGRIGLNMQYEESQPEINPFDIFATQTHQSAINARHEIGNVIPSAKKHNSSAKKNNKARGQQVYGTPGPISGNKEK